MEVQNEARWDILMSYDTIPIAPIESAGVRPKAGKRSTLSKP